MVFRIRLNFFFWANIDSSLRKGDTIKKRKETIAETIFRLPALFWHFENKVFIQTLTDFLFYIIFHVDL